MAACGRWILWVPSAPKHKVHYSYAHAHRGLAAHSRLYTVHQGTNAPLSRLRCRHGQRCHRTCAKRNERCDPVTERRQHDSRRRVPLLFGFCSLWGHHRRCTQRDGRPAMACLRSHWVGAATCPGVDVCCRTRGHACDAHTTQQVRYTGGTGLVWTHSLVSRYSAAHPALGRDNGTAVANAATTARRRAPRSHSRQPLPNGGHTPCRAGIRAVDRGRAP
ncbi:hypothetical protein C8Q77DRAFT_129068 [Trametes polyzona]|nr:hypothetical protein C8Q77DRAFT_129068 [Trametes polyzona]